MQFAEGDRVTDLVRRLCHEELDEVSKQVCDELFYSEGYPGESRDWLR